jgi:hypothetical protein
MGDAIQPKLLGPSSRYDTYSTLHSLHYIAVIDIECAPARAVLIFVYIHFGGFSPVSFSRDYIGWIDCIAVGGNRSDLQVSEH